MTLHNPICISSGHGLHIRGASGIVPPQVDEVDEARKIVDRVAQILKDGGVTVHKFHDNISDDQSENLDRIVDYHNSTVRTLDVSVHLNAFDHTAHGTEVLYVSQSSLASAVSLAIAEAGGFTNRGGKKNTGLAFLNGTDEPAILLEVFFCDNTSDCDKYRANFEAICYAIAVSIAGKDLDEEAPGRPPIDVPVPPERPPDYPPDHPPPLDPHPPQASTMPRPTISDGDYGSTVCELQKCLKLTEDGDFGPQTASATKDYQRSKGLTADGVVGPQTWTALCADFNLPSYPPPLPDVFTLDAIEEIVQLAWNHPISEYQWKDRGQAPAGYINGMALAYAQACVRLAAGDPIAMEMSKANTHDDAADAISWYDSDFRALGMSNEEAGRDTLRHLYVLMLGSGMRESSGQHCAGRDMSATNTSAETAESGCFQTSWNASSCCTDFLVLFDQYTVDSPQGYMNVWSEDVDCSSSDWQSYGSGDGYQFQEKCKMSPTFAVETHAITLRNLKNHYGPIKRKEVEIRKEADTLFQSIEDIVDTLDVE